MQIPTTIRLEGAKELWVPIIPKRDAELQSEFPNLMIGYFPELCARNLRHICVSIYCTYSHIP